MCRTSPQQSRLLADSETLTCTYQMVERLDVVTDEANLLEKLLAKSIRPHLKLGDFR